MAPVALPLLLSLLVLRLTSASSGWYPDRPATGSNSTGQGPCTTAAPGHALADYPRGALKDDAKNLRSRTVCAGRRMWRQSEAAGDARRPAGAGRDRRAAAARPAE